MIYNHSSPFLGANFISIFHISLFFIISGILCGLSTSFFKCDFREFIKRKMNNLIIPYIGWGILDFVVFAIVSPDQFHGITGLKKQLLYFILGQRSLDTYFFTGALWFLTALFSCYMVFYLIYHYMNMISKVMFYFALVLIGIITWDLKFSLPFNMDLLPYNLPLFTIGFIFSYKKCYQFYIAKGFNCALILLTGGLVYAFARMGVVDNFSRELGSNYFTYLIGSVSGTIFVFELSKLILLNRHLALIRFFSHFGRRSLSFMAIHQQLIIHPLNALGIFLSTYKYDFLLRFILSIVGSYVLDEIKELLVKHFKLISKKER